MSIECARHPPGRMRCGAASRAICCGASEVNAPNRLREALQEIAVQGNTRRYAAHTVLVQDHDDNDSLFIIVGGWVKVYADNASGKEVIPNTLGPGEYLGEVALDCRGRRRAAAPRGIERSARGCRSEPRRHRAPIGAAGRWLACVMFTLHRLERLLRGNQLRAVNVADGSGVDHPSWSFSTRSGSVADIREVACTSSRRTQSVLDDLAGSCTHRYRVPAPPAVSCLGGVSRFESTMPLQACLISRRPPTALTAWPKPPRPRAVVAAGCAPRPCRLLVHSLPSRWLPRRCSPWR